MADLSLHPSSSLRAPTARDASMLGNAADRSPAEQDRALWQSFRHHSKTFSLATRLLRREVRLPVAALYAYCRAVDSVADQRVQAVGNEVARAEVEQMRADLAATLAGQPPPALLWTRLAAVHAQFDLLPGPLYELLDGAAWDLDGRPVRTMDDLIAYSELVAGSVGAMMLPFLVRDRARIPLLTRTARALGNAMQLTNILRDVGEDWHSLGRVYLPADLMAAHGVTTATLQQGHPTPAYQALVEAVMVQAERLYDEAEAGIGALPGRAQAGIRAAARWYREILNEVRASGYDNLRRRNVVPLGRKARRLVHDGYARRKRRLATAG
ncbi:MAG: phytoene/squalene synthase family protein [Bacteroidota bacterium]